MATKYQDIKRQIAELEKKAAEARKSEVTKAIADIQQLIAEFDLTPEDVFPKGKKIGVKAGKGAVKPVRPAKYMDPKSGKTWSGIGKPPAWIAGAMKKGKKDDFLISKVEEARAAKATAKPTAKPTAKVTAPKTEKSVKAKPVAAKPVAKKPVVAKVAEAKPAAVKAKAKPVVAPKKVAAPAAKKPSAPKKPKAVDAPVAVPVSGKPAVEQGPEPVAG